VGPRAGLDAVAKRDISCRKSNSGRPAHRIVTILTELPRLRCQSNPVSFMGLHVCPEVFLISVQGKRMETALHFTYFRNPLFAIFHPSFLLTSVYEYFIYKGIVDISSLCFLKYTPQ
jgi:hypothetical protein